MKMTGITREEKIYVLYASQTGNSEQAAKDFCSQVPTKLSPEAIQQLTRKNNDNSGGGSNNNNSSENNTMRNEQRITVIPVGPMQMDDFLELHGAPWTRITILFTSSYGVGQAPLGGYRFRELCDAWMDLDDDDDDDDDGDGKDNKTDQRHPLRGLSYALCGLGDSKYTTYFQNPTRIDEAMRRVGAKRIGTVGKANASGTGENEQGLVIQRWMEDVWEPLAAAIVSGGGDDDDDDDDDDDSNNNDDTTQQQQKQQQQQQRLANARASTVALCRKINPDFMPEPTKPRYQLVSVLLVLVAVLVAFYLQNK